MRIFAFWYVLDLYLVHGHIIDDERAFSNPSEVEKVGYAAQMRAHEAKK